MKYSRKTYCCPFFSYDQGGGPDDPYHVRICCEYARLDLPDLAAYQEYTETYCASPSGWGSCPLARMAQAYIERMG